MRSHFHACGLLPAILLLSLLGGPGRVQAQTNPLAQSLRYQQDFGVASFIMPPAGMAAGNGLNGGSINSVCIAGGSSPDGDAGITSATSPQAAGATHECEGYRIANVIFESRPGFPVTANCYVPTGHSRPM